MKPSRIWTLAPNWIARGFGLLILPGCLFGCDSTTTAPPVVKSTKPLTIHRAEAPIRVFTAEEDVPPTSYTFQGARGSVRVTMEIEGVQASTAPTVLNDVLFRAVDDGLITVTFKRPWPGHDNGRVTIRCLSGQEVSSAEFEPELWFNKPPAIVTLESPSVDQAGPAVEGKEVVLSRYVARNLPRDIRLTFKATFTQLPTTPRTKAGLKPES